MVNVYTCTQCTYTHSSTPCAYTCIHTHVHTHTNICMQVAHALATGKHIVGVAGGPPEQAGLAKVTLCLCVHGDIIYLCACAYLCRCLPFSPSPSLPVSFFLSVALPLSLTLCLSLSVFMSICLSICMSVCLSVHQRKI